MNSPTRTVVLRVLVSGALVVLAGCTSVNSSDGLTPSQASRIASEASKQASAAAGDAVQGLVRQQVADELGKVAMAVKAYSDLGGSLREQDINMQMLSTIREELGRAQAAADAWSEYAQSRPESALTPALRADMDAFTSAVQAYLKQESANDAIWQTCIRQYGDDQLAVSTCIVTKVDAKELVSTFDDYVAALKSLAAEVGVRVT